MSAISERLKQHSDGSPTELPKAYHAATAALKLVKDALASGHWNPAMRAQIAAKLHAAANQLAAD